MYIVKAEADQIEKIVDMSVRAFETDVNVGGVKGDCPPEYDSVKWHEQMAREGHLYQAMIGKDQVGAAIIFQDETKNSVYIGRIFIDSIHEAKIACSKKGAATPLPFSRSYISVRKSHTRLISVNI